MVEGGIGFGAPVNVFPVDVIVFTVGMVLMVAHYFLHGKVLVW